MEKENINFDLFKGQAENYGKALKNMARTIIRNIPREMLIEILKKEKIIVQDWIKKGNVFVEVRNE